MISVVICTHNPRVAYFERVLTALQGQTLPSTEWELLVVDNASREPLSTRFAWQGFRSVRHLVEPRLGLMPARLRGIAEAAGDVIVFVDDDNVLAPDYLAQVSALAREHAFLGAWGGRITGEFEIEPPAWSRRYLGLLAIRDFERDLWSNSPEIRETVPCGAGLCIRTHVARRFADLANRDPVRFQLGRVGANLSSSDDTDLALTACDMGLGVGIFVRLELRHLIPKERLTLNYFVALMEALARSTVLLRSRRQPLQRPQLSRGDRLLRAYRWWHLDAETRAVQEAADRGEKSAYDHLGV